MQKRCEGHTDSGTLHLSLNSAEQLALSHSERLAASKGSPSRCSYLWKSTRLLMMNPNLLVEKESEPDCVETQSQGLKRGCFKTARGSQFPIRSPVNAPAFTSKPNP